MVSPYDSSVLLWGNKISGKKRVYVFPLALKHAWMIKSLQMRTGKTGQSERVQWPLDMKLNYDGEWYTYGFAPFIQSRGADLIDRKAWKAEGSIDSQPAVDALTELQAWSKAAGSYRPPLETTASMATKQRPGTGW